MLPEIAVSTVERELTLGSFRLNVAVLPTFVFAYDDYVRHEGQCEQNDERTAAWFVPELVSML